MQPRRPILIFLHIPKTGGTSVQSFLARNFEKAATFTLDVRDLPQSFFDLDARIQRSEWKLQLLKGHFVFGVHDRLTRPFTYTTLLRLPTERILSHYCYAASHAPHYLHEAVVRGRLSLGQYVSLGLATELDNGQVRVVSGVGKHVPFGGIGRKHLEQAIENIDRYFGAVGTLDRLDEYEAKLKERFGMDGEIGWRNATPLRLAAGEVSDADLACVRATNVYDQELYHVVSNRLAGRGGGDEHVA